MRRFLISVMGVLAWGLTGGSEGGGGMIWAMNEQEDTMAHGLSVLATHSTSLNYWHESVDSDSVTGSVIRSVSESVIGAGTVTIDIKEDEKQPLNGKPLFMISADVSKISNAHTPDQTVFTGNVTAEMLALKPASKVEHLIPMSSIPIDNGILWGGRSGQKDTLSSNFTHPSDFGGVSSVRAGTNQRTVSTGGFSMRHFFDRSKTNGQQLTDDFRSESFGYQASEALNPLEPLVKLRPSPNNPRKEDRLMRQISYKEDTIIVVNYDPPAKVSCWKRWCCCLSRKKQVDTTMSDVSSQTEDSSFLLDLSDASSQTEALPILFDLMLSDGWNKKAETAHNHGEDIYMTTASSDPKVSRQTRGTSSLSYFQSNGLRRDLSPEKQRVVHEWLAGLERSPTSQVFPQPIHSIGLPIRFEGSENSIDTARFTLAAPSGQ